MAHLTNICIDKNDMKDPTATNRESHRAAHRSQELGQVKTQPACTCMKAQEMAVAMSCQGHEYEAR